MTAAVQPRILLVDDQPANPAVLEALLRVDSGEAALRALRADEFAAVLLETRMPTLVGVRIAELIRRQPGSQSLPILFLSADTDTFPFERACALGNVDVLAALEQALATAIEGRA